MKYIISGSIVLIFVLVYILYTGAVKRKLRKAGKDGERIVAKILKSYAWPRSYKVFNDVYLPLYDKLTQIDHILVGFFGILVIETKNTRGEIYAQPNEKQWAIVNGGKKKYIYNPLMQNKTHVEAIRHLLISNKVFKIDIDSLVVFTSGKKATLYIKSGYPVILSNLLPKFLRKDRYETDKEVDVDQICSIIEGAIVTDRDRIKAHNRSN